MTMDVTADLRLAVALVESSADHVFPEVQRSALDLERPDKVLLVFRRIGPVWILAGWTLTWGESVRQHKYVGDEGEIPDWIDSLVSEAVGRLPT